MKITRRQLRGVRKMMGNRKARISRCGTYIEVRGTSRMENVDRLMATVDNLSESLGITLVYVDHEIYDATADRVGYAA